MILSIVIIGDEILLGQVTDTNSGAIARTFRRMGWQVHSVETVGDERRQITEAISRALAASDLVITTGGLGPTKDDITKGVLLEIFGGELTRDAAVTANIQRVFDLRGIAMNPLTADQALVPTSCKVIQNLYGTAPIMWFEREGRVLVSMPGVPFETEGMLPEVSRRVAACFTPDIFFEHHTLMVTGISESLLAQRLAEFEASLPEGLHLAYLPQPGIIRLRLDGSGREEKALHDVFTKKIDELRHTVGAMLIHDGDATPAEIVLELLGSRGLTLSTAESCTGGNIAHAITSVPGSSKSFLGSVVSYANEVKVKLIGVKQDDIDARGAVSREVVEQMVAGVCKATGSDCAVATSGIAGPGGGSADKPVGTVWIAAKAGERIVSRVVHLPGNRSRVIDRATTEALLTLAGLLREKPQS